VSEKLVSETTPEPVPESSSGTSRRGFLQTTAAVGSVATLTASQAEAQAAGRVGPAEVPVTLNINGKDMKANLEPRVTLLDALRNYMDMTAAKRVCDRGTCGACTVIMNGKSVYACSVLAVDAQGSKIETLEGIAAQNHPIIQAFVNNDAQQCGYCTPGFVVAAKAFLDKTPNPTYEQVKSGMSGNLCRCGTYVGVRQAVVEAGSKLKGGRA
jgi:xanthine dehydrogenase YagT iron-sulfur-binding subunit